MSIFSSVSLRPPKRSLFDLSFSNKLTCNMGELIPVFVQETIPGDVFRHSHQIFCQLAPMNAQVMQRFDLQVHYFHVPTRLIYEDFEDFLVGGVDGIQTFVPPYFTPARFVASGAGGMVPFPANWDGSGTLLDYMGLPSNLSSLGQSTSSLKDLKLSILPFRAYWKIYDDYFRDENLCPEQLVSVAGGLCSLNEVFNIIYTLSRAWRKDYFTSALPWTQKGAEVTLPLGDKAPVHFTSPQQPLAGTMLTPTYEGNGTENPDYAGLSDGNTMYPPGEAYADLQNATGSTIDQLRTAEMIQEWLEKNARGGTRYNEQIYSHFGVRTPDSRLDRCEYICKSTSPVTFGNVYSSNSNNGNNVQGLPVSTGQSQQVAGNFRYKVREHGYIMGIMSIRPRAAYWQGIPKSFIRNDKFDYYWPEFAHLGEQAIKDFELYASATTDPDKDFGYGPRYADQKCRMDEIHGDFRTNLKYMHDAREFAAQPSLSQQFIEVDQAADNLTRIFNNINANNNKFFVDMYHNVRAKRPMPYYGTPMFHS